jgi:uncharacterized protein (DUF1330 family)
MLILVQIDISQADLAVFEQYEISVLALLPRHGGRLIQRLRSVDAQSETHLLSFPDNAAFDAFRSDPMRAALQALWVECRASSSLTEVIQIQ